MVGLELQDDRAFAVAVDETGRILGRAEVASKDLASAAGAALDGVAAAASGTVAALGIAAINPESPDVQTVLRTLARGYGGPFVQEGAVASGIDQLIASLRPSGG